MFAPTYYEEPYLEPAIGAEAYAHPHHLSGLGKLALLLVILGGLLWLIIAFNRSFSNTATSNTQVIRNALEPWGSNLPVIIYWIIGIATVYLIFELLTRKHY